jgi:thiol-disulfide isomerase/thioredoxin
MKKNILLALLLVSSLLSLYWGMDYVINRQGSIDYPKAPRLEIQALDQKIYEVGDFKDRLLIVNFWASWCPPCLNELPLLIQIAKEFPDTIYILAILTSDEISQGLKVLNKYEVPANFKFMVDIKDGSREFGTSKLPETYLIGKNRDILDKISGDITSSQRDLRDIIRKNLK